MKSYKIKASRCKYQLRVERGGRRLPRRPDRQERTIEALVSESPAGLPINAQEVGGFSTLSLINNPLRLLLFKLVISLLHLPLLNSVFSSTPSKAVFTPAALMEKSPERTNYG